MAKKLLYPGLVLILVLLPGCRSVSPGSTGGPPLNVKVNLTANHETPIPNTKLILTLKSIDPGPPATATIDTKLTTMEIQRVLKVGDYLELGEYKVTMVTIGAPDKPTCEVQVIRQ
jgi:hypothetical protein